MKDEIPPATSISTTSGGVNMAGDKIAIGGDVVGRDKIVQGYTAGEVRALLDQISTTFQPRPFDGRCPYLGLASYDEDTADLFFGRERIVTELIDRVREARWVFVTGPSGSGKSSLVRAGLIHDLKHNALPDSERWLYEALKPGRDPLTELARVASSLAGTLNAGDDIRTKGQTDPTILHQWAEIALRDKRERRAVILVDQFEETFTQVAREAERVAFLNLLTYAATVEGGRVTLVFAMRSDFVSNCAAYPQLNDLLNQQFMQIGVMTPAELVSAIAQPALRVGLKVEPELVTQIIADMKGEPGALPLVQFALRDLFEAQQAQGAQGGVNALTLSDYLARGGIHKALERHADSVFAQLSEPEQSIAHAVFSGLIQVGRGAEDTRRTALFDELVPADVAPSQVEVVVGKLADARLIITDERDGRDIVTIAHEKLIDAWPWLRKLVNENRDSIALQNQIAEDADEWAKHQRDASYLYIGARLANAREQLAAKKIKLNGLAQAFVTAGVEAEGANRAREAVRIQKELDDARKLAESEKQRAEEQSRSAARLRRRAIYLTIAFAVASVAVVVAVIAGIQARAETVRAEQQAELAVARQLAAQSLTLVDTQPDVAALLSLESLRITNTVEARTSLLTNLQVNARLKRYLRYHDNMVHSVAFRPDGQVFATSDLTGRIQLWDAATYERLGDPFGDQGGISAIAFSPDGLMLASVGVATYVRVWDVSELRAVKPIGERLAGHTDHLRSVAFSPNGKLLASGGDDNQIIVWDTSNPRRGIQPIGPPLTEHSFWVQALAFSPDSKTLASGSYELILWDVSNPAAGIERINANVDVAAFGINSLAFNAQGSVLAVGADIGQSELLSVDLAPPQLRRFRRLSTANVNSLAFSHDDQLMAMAGGDDRITFGAANVGEAATDLPSPLVGHGSDVATVAFSPDGKTLISGSDNGLVIVWDLTGQSSLARPLPGEAAIDRVTVAVFDPNGQRVIAADRSDRIRSFDAATLEPVGFEIENAGSTTALVIGRDDKTIIAAGEPDLSSSIRLWDMATGQSVGKLGQQDPLAVDSLALSPDGQTLAAHSPASNGDGTIQLWNLRTEQPIGEPLNGRLMTFSPDGQWLALTEIETVTLYSTTTWQPAGPSLQVLIPNSIAFSPDSRTLALGLFDGRIGLLDASHPERGLELPGQVLIGHNSAVLQLAYSADGRWLASGAYDGAVIVWDVATRQAVGQPLVGASEAVTHVEFSPDGRRLLTSHLSAGAMLWDLDPALWQSRICAAITRNLSRAEWAQYLGDLPYRTTCDQWP